MVDNDLVIHYANPAAQQLLAQSSRKLFGTPLPELTGYFSLNIEVMRDIMCAAPSTTSVTSLSVNSCPASRPSRTTSIFSEKQPVNSGNAVPTSLR